MTDVMISTTARAGEAGHRTRRQPTPARFDSMGFLTRVAVEESAGNRLRRLFSRRGTGSARSVLTIEGWAASSGAGPIERIEVRCAGRTFEQARVELGLASPDVASTRPHLDSAGRCRFRVQVPLSAEQRAQVRGAAVTCTSHFKGQPGCILAGLNEPVIAPPSQFDSDFVGRGEFLEISCEFLGHILHKGGLQPTEDVLDIGCGIGRIAYSMAHYMAPPARYEGFDIVDGFVALAQGMITPRFPNFQFRKVEVYNKCYNPSGTMRSTEFRFPYDDASFDFLFLTSVFTHMLGPEVRHYLDEMRRVLRPGGRCLCTCFLLNPESMFLIQAGRSAHDLVHEVGEGRTSNPEVPEDAIGFEEPLLLRWVAERGLTVAGKYYGSWCGRPATASFQDILILHK